jgi:hypothetical protein
MAALAAAAAAALAAPAAASAADPGRWVVVTKSTVPNAWRQGLAADTSGNVFFSGPFVGIHRTVDLVEKQSNNAAIPPDVAQREQYNHIGDLAWDAAEGGRLLLPLESYKPFDKDPNPSKTGSIGVMSSATLKWSYYVKLDPAEIPKAQWSATAPDGLFWTLTDKDLLAYRLADLTPANAAPAAAPIHSVKRIPGVVPGGSGGAAALGGRLYMSSDDNGVNGVFSVDLATGASQVEFEQSGGLEAEGVDFGPYLGGILHAQYASGLSSTQLLSLLPTGTQLRLRFAHNRVRAGRPAKLKATVTAAASGYTVAVPGVQVRVGRARAKTDASGRATLRVKLTRGGYRAHAFFKGLRTGSSRVRATS